MTVLGRLLAFGDIRVFLGFLTFCVVILVLAYLTNPSESSFRAYLTEQSFRLHLSRLDRLDDPQDDVNPRPTPSITSDPTCAFSLDNHALVHFATRASVSLRTPKHVFHSFGIFTVATMLPMAKAPQRNDSHLSSVVNDSWYVGAFGKWLRGGGIEAWYQDVIARSKDEESTSSGILSLANLDIRHDYPGLPTHRGVLPKLRNRERSSQRTNGPHTRPETPPPLPKSASLPLHASGPKHLSCISWPNINTPTLSTLCLSNSSPEQTNQGANPETLPNFSPRVTELLRQISQTQRTVLDLKAQLSDGKTATSQSRLHLQGNLDTQRDCRRQEDAIKVELKSRTKSLDDSKRQAEGLKREAEKKLRVVQIATTNATDFLSALGEKIIQLQVQMADDQSFIALQPAQQSVSISSLTEELDTKKQEIKATEVHVSTLSQHARELEGKLSEARERLKHLKHKTGIRKSDMQQMMDDRLVRSLSSILTHSTDEQDPSAILLERLRPDMSDHHMNRPEASLAAALETPTDSGCSPASLHHYETKLPIDPSKRISLGDRPATFLPDVISSRESSAASSAIPSPESVFILGREGSAINSYSTNIDAHRDQRETKLKLNGDHGADTKYHLNTVPGSAWGHPPEYEHVGVEAFPANTGQHDWHQFGLPESGSRFDTIPDSRRSATTGHLDTSTLYPLGYHPGTAPVATTSNPSLIRAFAPSLAERQVFQRTLGSISNASLERLPSLGDVGRVPISPPRLTGTSRDLPNRALPPWLLLPQNHHVNFSPWDDEEQERSS